jgi:hypothetical protein
VRKGVEQHLVLVQERTFFTHYFSVVLLTMIGTLKNKGVSCIGYECLQPQ